MTAEEHGLLRRLHLLLDTVTVLGAMALAVELQAWLRQWFALVKPSAAFHEHALLAYLTVPLWLVLVAVFRLHRSFEHIWGTAELLTDLFRLHLTGLAVLSVIQVLTQSVINRSLLGLFLLCSFAAMYGVRMIASTWTRYHHRAGYSEQRLLLVGRPSGRMSAFLSHVASRPLPPRVVGYLEAPLPHNPLSTPPCDALPVERIGSLSELERVLHEQSIDVVLFFPPCNDARELVSPLSVCETLGVTAAFSVDLVQLARAVPRVGWIYDHPFVAFDVAPRRLEATALKHVLDPVFATVLIALLWPLMLLTALAIRISMGRPVLFVQERAGLNGRPFRMLKFRTMGVDAEQRKPALAKENEMCGPVFKLRGDPRVTRLGRFLRRSSLDELPQLFNVLAGSMSLVGPRPLPLREQAEILGWHRRRLSVKPGLTCLWQVSGRNDLDFEDWMLLDLKYIDEWSLTLDLWILLKTLPAVLLGRGAR